MFCKYCGSKLSENAKFCKKCGKEVKIQENILENSNVENADNEIVDNSKDNKDNKNNKNKKDKKDKKDKKKRSFSGIMVKLFILLIILLMIVILLDYFGIIQFSDDETKKNENLKERIEESVDFDVDDVQIEHPDADSYYEQNAELISSYSVTESKDIHTEKSVEQLLTERGFIDYPILADYTIDGIYYDASETTGSEEKHPMYQTYYVSSNNELWNIIVVNDSVMANPLSYNMQSELEVQILFAESNVVTSYDSVTNKFYESIPHESELIVKVTEKIDATTLEKLSIEVIEKYE